MEKTKLQFDLMAMAAPKTRQDCIVLAKEILAELENISQHISAAIARCEKAQPLSA
jgi:hypothetical protein